MPTTRHSANIGTPRVVVKDPALSYEASPTITSGNGVPSAVEPAGSIYLRTGVTTADTAIYVRFGGNWVAMKGAT